MTHQMLNNEGSKTGIRLERMLQQLEVRLPEDDWTGVNSTKERRRLQNRLNQRIYRRRRRAKPDPETRSPTKTHSSDDSDLNPNPTATDNAIATTNGRDLPEHGSYAVGVISGSFDKAAGRDYRMISIHSLSPPEILQKMIQYELLARQNYTMGSPRADQLLTLIQFNVFRALVDNTHSLGFPMDWLQEDAISPWNIASSTSNEVSCPTSLYPTTVQRNVRHHPWIDLFPFPQMRDNLLQAAGSYDEYALCNDLVDFYDVPHEQTGLIVWGEPWDPSGWEVSEAFVKKWAWVIYGCNELLKSTNDWRRKRGERDLIWKSR